MTNRAAVEYLPNEDETVERAAVAGLNVNRCECWRNEFLWQLSLYNKAIKVVPGLRPSTGRPCQGAAYGWR